MISNTTHASAIIVSWNTKELLRICIQGLLKQEGVQLDVFVVDNNSMDGTQEMVRSEFPMVRLIANTRNAGFAAANNQALQIAKGDYLVLVNPDIEFKDTSVLKTLFDVQRTEKSGISGPTLLNVDGSVQHSVRSDPTFASQFLTLLKVHILLPNLGVFKKYYQTHFDYTHTQTVGQISGAFFSISRACFNVVGLLDEDFYIWFEEVDYCLRAKHQGYSITYIAETSVIHHGGQSFQKVIPLNRQKIYNKSLLIFAKKYFTSLQWFCLKIFSPVSVFLAAITPKQIKPSTYRGKK